MLDRLAALATAFRSSVWSTLLVLVLLNLIGRNMGEVARLWMLFMPPLLVAAGVGISRLGLHPAALGVTAALLGARNAGAPGIDPGGATRYELAAPEGRRHRKRFVTRTPRSVSICTSSPRATSRPFDVELDRSAAVAAELDDVAGLQFGELIERQIDAAQLDRQRDRHVERSDPGSCSCACEVVVGSWLFSKVSSCRSDLWFAARGSRPLPAAAAGRRYRRPAWWES